MDDPLRGFAWNQLEETPRELEEALITIVAGDGPGVMQVVGTGFVVRALDTQAFAVTAAHVLDEVHRLRWGRRRASHTSTLPEFLPPPPPFDLSPKGLLALSLKESRVVIAKVTGVAIDISGDFGALELSPQEGSAADFPLREFIVEDAMPEVGQLVCCASYASLASEADGVGTVRVKRRAVLRIGSVVDVFPEGQRLCQGPCFEVSFPVYSGMSGGPVFYYDESGPMRVVGLVCSDPDVDGPAKDDRFLAGRALIAKLPVRRLSGSPQGKQEVEFTFRIKSAAGSLASGGKVDF